MAEGFTPTEDFYREDEFYDERGQTKDENIEMKNRDSWEQTPEDFTKPPEEETSFVDNLPVAPDTLEPLEQQEKILNFYKFILDRGFKVDRDAPLAYKALYRMNDDKELFINYKGKEIRLTQINNPNEFLAPRTIALMYGKGIKAKPIKIPPEQRKELLEINKTIDSTNST